MNCSMDDLIKWGIGLLLAAYAYIFKTVIERIRSLEKRPLPVCHYPEVTERLKSMKAELSQVKDRQDGLEQILREVVSTMAEVKEAISWLKEKK